MGRQEGKDARKELRKGCKEGVYGRGVRKGCKEER
jgi:hypothetical protein